MRRHDQIAKLFCAEGADPETMTPQQYQENGFRVRARARPGMTKTFRYAALFQTSLAFPRRTRGNRSRNFKSAALGRYDFAVRLKRVRLARQSVHRIPRPTSVTIAIRPS
jgi:hypothetical protein